MSNKIDFKINQLTGAMTNQYVRVEDPTTTPRGIIYEADNLTTDASGNATVELGNSGTLGQNVIVYCDSYPSDGLGLGYVVGTATVVVSDLVDTTVIRSAYVFSPLNDDSLEIETFTGTIRVELAATSELGINSAILAGRVGAFVVSTDLVNDPQWVTYEASVTDLETIVSSSFSGIVATYYKDGVPHVIDMGEY